MSKYEKISSYLSFMSDKYNLHICIKDFCGFIPINKELDEALRPFLTHTNPFCMYIKSDRNKYHTCLTMIRKMYDKYSNKCTSYYGVCHAGLGEYIIPIVAGDIILGSINVGFFQPNEKLTAYSIKRACRNSQLNSDTALKLYNENIAGSTIDPETIISIMEMLAEYLGSTYSSVQSTHSSDSVGKRYYSSCEDTIISHAIEYIRQNYKQKITVEEIANFCHCSVSYISRIFKKRTGVNLNVYINKVRIEFSKNYLLLTNSAIADIALNAGFDDPNYFSRVFTNMIGIPPTEFRRRFRDDANFL